MSGFTKLVPEIIQSSIWNEPSDIRIVWITMLAIKDADGFVRGDSQTLARMANVPHEAVIQALERFQSPDPGSGTPDNEGRRIAPAAGGWVVLNHELYRIRDHQAEHTEYMRQWRERRANAGAVKKRDSQVKGHSASASISDVSSEGDCKGAKKPDAPPLPFPSPEFASAWADWQQHRKEIKKPLKPTMIRAQLATFAEWGEARSIAAIRHTISKGWQGLREPDGEQRPGTGKATDGWRAN